MRSEVALCRCAKSNRVSARAQATTNDFHLMDANTNPELRRPSRNKAAGAHTYQMREYGMSLDFLSTVHK
jgi:hypothetical protein